MLHLDNHMGSVKVGKDADLVLWSDNPTSIYARVEKTIVDGKVLYDNTEDLKLRESVNKDRSRIIQKMIAAKNKGAATQRPSGRRPRNNEADEDDEFVSGDIDGVGQINSNGK